MKDEITFTNIYVFDDGGSCTIEITGTADKITADMIVFVLERSRRNIVNHHKPKDTMSEMLRDGVIFTKDFSKEAAS